MKNKVSNSYRSTTAPSVSSILEKIGVVADTRMLRNDVERKQLLIMAINYYSFLVKHTQGFARLNPFFWYNGQKGITDVLFYMHRIISPEVDPYSETVRFLTGKLSNLKDNRSNSSDNESFHSSNFSLCDLPITTNFISFRYGDTTGSKLYSRISFFKNSPVFNVINEKTSFKSLSHNVYINIFLVLSTIFLLTALFLTVPYVTPILMALTISNTGIFGATIFPAIIIPLIIGLIKIIPSCTRSRFKIEESGQLGIGQIKNRRRIKSISEMSSSKKEREILHSTTPPEDITDDSNDDELEIAINVPHSPRARPKPQRLLGEEDAIYDSLSGSGISKAATLLGIS